MAHQAESQRALPDPQTEPTVTVERAGRVLGISRGAAYAAAESGDLPVIRIGARRIVVPTAALLRMLHVDGSRPAA